MTDCNGEKTYTLYLEGKKKLGRLSSDKHQRARSVLSDVLLVLIVFTNLNMLSTHWLLFPQVVELVVPVDI